jgi:hypothetical protein
LILDIVRLLLLNPVADNPEEEVDQCVHRIVMLLGSKAE